MIIIGVWPMIPSLLHPERKSWLSELVVYLWAAAPTTSIAQAEEEDI